MNSIDQLVCENERFGAAFRIQPLISPSETEHLFNLVSVMHFEEQRPDYIVKSGTQPSAGYNAGASFRRIEEQLFARACQFKEDVIRRLRISATNDCGGNALRVLNPALQR